MAAAGSPKSGSVGILLLLVVPGSHGMPKFSLIAITRDFAFTKSLLSLVQKHTPTTFATVYPVGKIKAPVVFGV